MKRQALFNPISILSPLLALGVMFIGLPVAVDAQTPTFTLELVGEVPSSGGIEIDYIEAIQVLDSDPNEIVFVTRNKGASCDEGTPATAWKMTLDPDTGKAVSVVLKQSLSQIQNVRGVLFESSDGTLFTGSGWCGYKPPYYSTDSGETWQSADTGPVYPPNSTFSFVEFNGDVYVGTGYEPYDGQIYRWLGAGHWELVLDVPPPRSIVGTMAVYQNQLFVGSSVYGWEGVGCESSVPVYVSADGNTFNAMTAGIPPCYSVWNLLVVGDQLVARVVNYFDTTEDYMYRWNNDLGEWEEMGVYNLGQLLPILVSLEGVIYAYGQAPSDPSAGVYQSVDMGQTWQQIAVFDDFDVYTMAIQGRTLYFGTYADASNTAYIYRLRLVTEVEIDIKPGSDPNSINLKSKGVVPVAVLTTDDFDASDVDPGSVEFAGALPERWTMEDVDSDGDMDLLLHFKTQELDLDKDSTQATLTGQTHGGLQIKGTDMVKIVPQGK